VPFTISAADASALVISGGTTSKGGLAVAALAGCAQAPIALKQGLYK